jgi:uncharacterized protein
MDVRKNEPSSRYELVDGDEVVGIGDYRIDGDVVVLPHTEISSSRRGQGLGALLVRGMLDDLSQSGRTVVPACWFVAEFIDANPSYQHLVAT